MKQKEIIIDSGLDLQAEEMVNNFFLIKTVSGIQNWFIRKRSF